MKPELVIFDMDGTILDTLEDLKESLNAALAANGFPERTMEETRRFVGNGIAKLMERAVPAGTSPEVTAKVLADFKVHYAAHCADHTRPYAGVPELLADLRAVGVLTAVVSNKADFAVQILARDYFPGLFDCAGRKRGHCQKARAGYGQRGVTHAERRPRRRPLRRGLGSGRGDRPQQRHCRRVCDMGVSFGGDPAGGRRHRPCRHPGGVVGTAVSVIRHLADTASGGG